MISKKSIVWFEEVNKNDVGLVGGKGANLGEMVNANLPIPYGFILTSHVYFDFIHRAKLESKIKDMLSIINYDNPSELQQASHHIKQLILDSEMPNYLIHSIVSHYEQLEQKEESSFSNNSLISEGAKSLKHLFKPAIVAVRSSATAEDLPTASFAGQQETYLNVQGDARLLNKVKECWASLFTPRAIYYRFQQGFSDKKVGLAVVVQRMVQSQKSGISFSIDPVTNDKGKIVIEAIYGLGEYIVGGKVTPDHYEVDKKSFVILKKEVKEQRIMLKKSAYSNKEVELSKSLGNEQKLSDEEIIKVAFLVKDIEKHYFFPQDIEWAIEKDRVYIVQSRPITTIKSNQSSAIRNQQDAEKLKTDNRQPILTGSPASPGIGVGSVNIIHNPREIFKIRHGDILVAPQTNPDYVPAMKKAAAIITDKGGRTSHAAIVSRELGIPAVVGTEKATKILKNEMVVTVNGATGEVFKGKISNQSSVVGSQQKKDKLTTDNRILKTKTHVYVNLAEPEQAQKIAKMNVDGVGLLRAEFIIAQIGTHPKEFIRQKKQHLFINKLAKDLSIFSKAFSPRPVIYRATDFKTNEYRNLKGGREYEPHEENPMLGFRGAYRYIANSDVFQLELEAIKKIYQLGYRNLHLMIPFVRVPWELVKVKELVQKAGLTNLPGFEFLIMVEVPACALNLEEFIKIGINGVSIGTNDLTMMLLGVDRDNEEVSQIYDERHPAVVKVLRDIVTTSSKYKITSSICGQAASDYPDLVEELVQAGITSVSVNPDAIDRTRELIYNIEKKM
ncbi:phosphoenolpyruvate synthase [Candidatus Roizmanbacteria bacterium]|nr:phosphoenolpyruvate synthase [Candidatus Roizmanbacteria bacterium]